MTCHSTWQARLGPSIQNPSLQMILWVFGAIGSSQSSLCLFNYFALVSSVGSNISHLCLGRETSRSSTHGDCTKTSTLISFGNVSSYLIAQHWHSTMWVPLKLFTTYFWSFTQISVSLAKDEPDTNLVGLMKEEGVKLLREAMGIYISTLKTGIPWVLASALRR